MKSLSKRSPRRCHALPALAVAVLAASGFSSATAETGGREVFPEATIVQGQPVVGPSAQTGLLLEVDTRWAIDYGYRPITFSFSSPTPSPADRSITVRVVVSIGRLARQTLSIEEDIDLPAGSSSAVLTMAVPQLSADVGVDWQVWVDGVRDPSLAIAPGKGPVGLGSRQNGQLNVLMPPQSATQATFGQVMGLLGGARNRANGSGLPSDEVTRVELPERWLHYTGLDVVRLTAEELLETKEASPQAFEALRQWVQTGGWLWVTEVGKRMEQLPAVSEALAIEARPLNGLVRSLEIANKAAPSWRWVDLRWRDAAKGAQNNAGQGARAARPSQGPTTISTRNWFAEAGLGFGFVTAFEGDWDDDLLSWRSSRRPSAPEMRRTNAFERLRGNRSWSIRHGVALDAASADFSNLLVTEVGLAPVTGFRVLITAFVLVVGPLNFWALRRRRRGHLMVLTVPITGALATAALLSYAILGDGFGVTLRARSVTLLDQRSGEATSWNRICYYAGMTPRDGLVFPDNTAVYPLVGGWNDPTGQPSANARRELEWASGEQRLVNGWLPPRELTQLLTVRNGPSAARVDVGDGSATNRLGADLALLVVRDAEGDFWMAEGAGQDETVTLQPVELLDALKALRLLASENTPETPAEVAAAASSDLLSGQRRQRERDLQRQWGIDYGAERLSENRLNQMLNRLLGIDGGDALMIAPQSYVAIAERTAWLPLGLEDATESGSFHVVIGAW